MDHRVSIAIRLVEANLPGQLSIADIADLVHLSASRFNVLFKQETGESFHNYVKRQRLCRAQILLETTLLNIKEIMAAVGLTDISHFVRDFKQFYGTSPTAYRTDHLNTDSIVSSFQSRSVKSANRSKNSPANQKPRQRTVVVS